MVRWVPIASSTALLTNSCSSALWHWQAARTWTRLETQGDGLECHYILISTQWLCITSLDFIAYNYMYSTCTCCLNNWFCPNCSPPSEWCSLSGQQRTFAMVPKLERWTKTQQLCEHAAAQTQANAHVTECANGLYVRVSWELLHFLQSKLHPIPTHPPQI